MTVHNDKPNGAPQSITPNPIQGSRKVYATPEGCPDVRVPFREIALMDLN